ncbi:hypothetical protein P3T24_001765 [Paraburkholderia sp. GAS33]|uniref:hypothetical protein n=1 Tax=Paraburkholderia sp. GAS33 TaxID=3035130 RepID=UPI003D207418
MEIEIVKSSWRNLQLLQKHIQQRIKSSGVKDMEKCLMKAIADVIPGEHRRSEVIDGDLSDHDLTTTVSFKITRVRKHEAKKPVKRELSSLLAELDAESANGARTDVGE